MTITDLTKQQKKTIIGGLRTICEEHMEICRLCPLYLEEEMSVHTKNKGSMLFDCAMLLLKEVL